MTDEQEEWRPVVGYEGSYEVSSLGNVRSVDREVEQWVGTTRAVRTLRGRPMRLIVSYGYRKVGLSQPAQKQRLIFVHRLVAEAFLGPMPSLQHQVAHGNGARHDNRLGNLRWSTPADNSADKARHGTLIFGEDHYDRRLTREQVRQIRARSGPRTDCALAREYGVSSTAIRAIRLRKNWKQL